MRKMLHKNGATVLCKMTNRPGPTLCKPRNRQQKKWRIDTTLCAERKGGFSDFCYLITPKGIRTLISQIKSLLFYHYTIGVYFCQPPILGG